VIVLDANVLIGFLDANDPHHEAASDLIERRFADGFAASVLTMAEVLVHPTRAGLHDVAAASLARIGVRVIPLEASESAALARVRSSYRIRMPDAVVLHTASATGSELATFDDALAAAARRAGIAVTR
jgi:predicted nucleic acid-binding protein